MKYGFLLNRMECCFLLHFLICGCTTFKSQKPLSGSGEPSNEFSKLVERGNFTPSTILTKEVANFQSFKKGWLVNFNLNVFSGSYGDQIRAGVNPPSPSIFNLKNV